MASPDIAWFETRVHARPCLALRDYILTLRGAGGGRGAHDGLSVDEVPLLRDGSMVALSVFEPKADAKRHHLIWLLFFLTGV